MKFSFNAKIYFLSTGTRAAWGGSAGADGYFTNTAPSNLTLIGGVRDAEIGDEDETFDATTRDTGGYEVEAPTLTKLPITFDLLWNLSDAGQAALTAAKINKGTIAIAVLDGDKATSGSAGYWADFIVKKMAKGEKLKEGQLMNVELFPGVSNVPPQKVKVT